MARVTLLGTGKMGAAIARRLAAAGVDLTLWNRTPARARAVAVGRVLDDPREAAAEAEVVLSILTDAEAVRSVYGRLEPRPEAVYVDLSTAGYDVLEELRGRFEHLLAAPVLGSPQAFEQGRPVLLVGGAEADLERARPVLEAFGEPRLVGDYRTALGLKLVNNAMLGMVSAVAGELQVAGEAAGLDPEAVFALLQRMVPYLAVRKPSYTDRDHRLRFFYLRDMVKDLDLALAQFHEGGAGTPLLALTRELFAGQVADHGDDELSAIVEAFTPAISRKRRPKPPDDGQDLEIAGGKAGERR
jgi:3-hydroxyisobutyrate dehydrogenase